MRRSLDDNEMKSDVSMSAIESRARHLAAAIVLILAGAVSGCAHTNPRDPFETFNRGVYTFNDTVDRMVLKPVAQGYRAVFPQFVRTGVRNFFSNLDDITVFINGVLQFKLPQAFSDAGRFVLNSTVGLAGLFDVATHLGLEKHNEDFGQTLGYWGIGSGPYLVLPFLGPSSIRDGIGRVADYYTDVVWRIDDKTVRYVLVGTRIVSTREQLLDTEKVLDAAALDRYAFIRDAYLQRRRNLVYDGNPPPEPEENDSPPAEPRSEAPVAPFSVLVDQFGNVVAGPMQPAGFASPAAATAPAPHGTPAGAPSGAVPDASGRSEPATGAGSQVVSPSGDESAQSESNTPARAEADPPQVVRVWLPGASAR